MSVTVLLLHLAKIIFSVQLLCSGWYLLVTRRANTVKIIIILWQMSKKIFVCFGVIATLPLTFQHLWKIVTSNARFLLQFLFYLFAMFFALKFLLLSFWMHPKQKFTGKLNFNPIYSICLQSGKSLTIASSPGLYAAYTEQHTLCKGLEMRLISNMTIKICIGLKLCLKLTLTKLQ